jgi:hypothetical protein
VVDTVTDLRRTVDHMVVREDLAESSALSPPALILAAGVSMFTTPGSMASTAWPGWGRLALDS